MKLYNLQAERLVREASDYMLYFEKPAFALKILDRVLDIVPNHSKALTYKGDIFYLKGDIESALEQYSFALKNDKRNPKILASIANCYDAKNNFKTALDYVDKAFLNMNEKHYSVICSLYELKISLLVKTNKIKSAKDALDKAKGELVESELKWLLASYHPVIKKEAQKSYNSNLKVVTVPFK